MLIYLQYWGWCKRRYREIYKERFAEAKMAMCECLDACPVDVIHRFFNCSWRFIDVYRQGLRGSVTEWAVRKYKSHRRVGPHVGMLIDAVLN